MAFNKIVASENCASSRFWIFRLTTFAVNCKASDESNVVIYYYLLGWRYYTIVDLAFLNHLKLIIIPFLIIGTRQNIQTFEEVPSQSLFTT